MKKLFLVFLGVFFLLLLGIPEMSFAYDSSPHRYAVIPEAIWSPSAGAGTWTTQLQIYSRSATTTNNLTVYFLYSSTGTWRSVTITGPAHQRMFRWTNILSSLQSADPSFTYYGRVGAILIAHADTNGKILAQARTVHSGGYGKTLNGASHVVEGNYGQFSPSWRALMIQGIYKGSVYRSAVGITNPSNASITVRVALINYNDTWLGWQDIVLPGWSFVSFDPFARFGVTTTNTSCRIWISPQAGTGKVMAFGATADNYTNDPSAHVAVQYD